jgi:hypothetical protein
VPQRFYSAVITETANRALPRNLGEAVNLKVLTAGFIGRKAARIGVQLMKG